MNFASNCTYPSAWKLNANTLSNSKILLCLTLLAYHAISCLEWIGISFILSMSWRNNLLTSGSLQQKAIDAAINKWTRQLTVCVQTDNSLNTCCELLIRPEKNHGQIKWRWLGLFSKRWKRCSFTAYFMILRFQKFPKVRYVHWTGEVGK